MSEPGYEKRLAATRSTKPFKANEVQQAKAPRASRRQSKQSRQSQPLEEPGRVPVTRSLSFSRCTAAGLTETTGRAMPTAVSSVLDTELLL